MAEVGEGLDLVHAGAGGLDFVAEGFKEGDGAAMVMERGGMVAGEEGDMALGAMGDGAGWLVVERVCDVGGGVGEAAGGAEVDAGEGDDALVERVDELDGEVGVLRGEGGVATGFILLLSECGEPGKSRCGIGERRGRGWSAH
jgi:hypothetical protein